MIRQSEAGGASRAGGPRAPIRIPKTAEVVADKIRRLIVSGALVEGDALQSEAKAIEDFSVSRPTVREAFRILESEQLITVARGSRGGARVHAPKPELVTRYAGFVLQSRGVSWAEVYIARSIIEPPAVRLLADRRPMEAASVLRQKISEQKAARNSSDLDRAVADFHSALIDQAGNGALTLLASVLDGILAFHGRSAPSRRVRSDRDSNMDLRSRERLVELIGAGEGIAAEAHWRRHLDAAAKIWLSGDAGQQVVTRND